MTAGWLSRFASRAMLLLAACCWLSACSPKMIPLAAGTMSTIKTIGIVTPGFPAKASSKIWYQNNQPMAGLLVRAIWSQIRAAREKNLNAIVAERHYDAGGAFFAALQDAVHAAGYTVVPLPVGRRPREFLKQYPSNPAQPVDAYLDMYADYFGLLANGFSAADGDPFWPSLDTEVRLVRASDNAVLLQMPVDFDAAASIGKLKRTPVAAGAVPVPRGEIKTHPDAVMTDLSLAVNATAVAIARSLK